MRQRRLWTPEEDKVLKVLRQQQKIKKWSVIAKMMEEDYYLPNRTGKQCRQRYFNHLDSEIKHEEWTEEQQRILWQMHSQYGNRWTLMTSRIKGRSQNCIKNHFYSKLRKAVRRLNKLIIDRFKTQFRQIKTGLLYKILESAEDKFRPGKSTNIETMQLATSIKNRLFLYETEALEKGKQLQVAKTLIRDANTLEQRLKFQQRHMKNTSGFLDPRSLRSSMDHSFESEDNYSIYSSSSFTSSFQVSEEDYEEHDVRRSQRSKNRSNLKLLNKLSLEQKKSSEMQSQDYPGLNLNRAQHSLPGPSTTGKKQSRDQQLLGGQLVQSLTLRPTKSQKSFSFNLNNEDKVSDIQPTRNTRGEYDRCLSDIAKRDESDEEWDNEFLYPKSNNEDDIGLSFFDEPHYGEFQIVVNSPKVPSDDGKDILGYDKIQEEAF